MAAAELDGRLYVAVDLSARRPENGGLFRRDDGPSPRWQRAGGWGPPPRRGVDALGVWLRGLTQVPDPLDPRRNVLLAGREADGVIERIDGAMPPSVVREADVPALLAGAWGSAPGSRYVLIAYNDMTKVQDPATGAAVHLIGLAVPGTGALPQEMARSGWYLVRDVAGNYAVGRVPEQPAGSVRPAGGLRAVRTIAASPLAGEAGRAWYFGGYDAARGPHVDTAWIARGALPP